jgi:hypothetical protein
MPSAAAPKYLVHLADQRLHIPDHAASGEVSSANPNFIRTDEDLTALGPGHLKLDATAELVRPREFTCSSIEQDYK